MSSQELTQARSVGVVLPTRNCAPLLAAHLESMTAWLDLVDEVVVVDSESCDGTREMIRERLRHPSVRWLDHPPGLYQCWNLGIQNLHTDYIYISTVGDGITREGLLHLREVADRFKADVVISEPEFIDESGAPIDPFNWPVRRLITLMNLGESASLQGWPLFLFAVAFCPVALLGSSASNLYRGAFLQAHPFPTDFGFIGDTAWGVINALSIRLAVTPRGLSSFRVHAKPYSLKEYHMNDLGEKIWRLGLRTLQQASHRRIEGKPEVDGFSPRPLFDSAIEVHRWSVQLDQERKRIWPWILNPAAWHARHSRNLCHRRMQHHLAAVFRELVRLGVIPSHS